MAAGSKRAAKQGRAASAAGGTAVSREQDLADLLRWAGEEIGVKVPKLKGGFVDGLRGAWCGGGVYGARPCCAWFSRIEEIAGDRP